MPTLSVFDPIEVTSPTLLDVFLGDPQRHMMIFAGIANPRWDSAGSLDTETVVVNLGQRVVQPPGPGDWTATVGLANLNNTESDFVFALNKVADVRTDPNGSGELQLVVEIAVLGDDSVLNSFSYMVTVVAELHEVHLKSILLDDNVEDVFVAPGQPTPTPSYVFSGSPEIQRGNGDRWNLRVDLDGPAPDPGVVVTLTSGIDSVLVPVPVHSILIQPGHTASDVLLSDPIQDPFHKVKTATITASYQGQTRTALIHLDSPGPN